MKNYQDLVYSTAVRLLGKSPEAQDISQEVFLKAYRNFDSLQSSPTAGGWLKTVTRNLCLNHLTRYRARWRFFSEMGEEDQEVEFPDHGPINASTPTGEDDRELLEGILQKLPEGQRVPLVLYHFENMSYEDIAAKLRVSLSKVKTDIFRARARMRTELEKQSGASAELRSLSQT